MSGKDTGNADKSREDWDISFRSYQKGCGVLINWEQGHLQNERHRYVWGFPPPPYLYFFTFKSWILLLFQRRSHRHIYSKMLLGREGIEEQRETFKGKSNTIWCAHSMGREGGVINFFTTWNRGVHNGGRGYFDRQIQLMRIIRSTWGLRETLGVWRFKTPEPAALFSGGSSHMYDRYGGRGGETLKRISKGLGSLMGDL